MIEEKQIKGYLGIQLLKRKFKDEFEFTTIMRFENIDAVKQFAGEDYELAFVPNQARALLSHFDEKCAHCEVIHELFYDV